jgi:hypothetical protein
MPPWPPGAALDNDGCVCAAVVVITSVYAIMMSINTLSMVVPSKRTILYVRTHAARVTPSRMGRPQPPGRPQDMRDYPRELVGLYVHANERLHYVPQQGSHLRRPSKRAPVVPLSGAGFGSGHSVRECLRHAGVGGWSFLKCGVCVLPSCQRHHCSPALKVMRHCCTIAILPYVPWCVRTYVRVHVRVLVRSY